ncbi:hypothetical protein [Paraflavitalea sp. CAU 1676]|uniref:hypothetical protein n=1 Tax=Paraflavitalea sp. CAU 1676 TaxID=3032598 RepID=UPI0023DA3EAE|nr:hypothetical protein [Paraflavitalea sp. CAU 1676]MDF2193146.1 hypothetical protein [Paraflavitalea sp. CAU 1676]
MSNTLSQRIGFTFKVWFIAVLVNTAIGTAFLALFLGPGFVPLLLQYGAGLGLIVSSPALLVIPLTLALCVRKGLSGVWTYRVMIGVAAILGLTGWLIYMAFFKEFNEENYVLLAIAIVSGVVAVCTQQKKLYALGDYSSLAEKG